MSGYYDEKTVLKDIKDGVVKLKGDLEGRLKTVEGWVMERKKGIAGAQIDAEDFFAKLAVANLLRGQGHQDCFERVGLTTIQGKEVMEYTRKAADTGTGGAGGGFVVPPQYVAAFIEVLRAKMVVIRAGATIMDNLNGSPVQIPKQLTSASVQWIGQNATLTASDPSFGQVTMTPKTLAIRAQYSNLLGMLSSPAMESVIKRDFAAIAGLELDRVALRGSGASNQPLGLMNIPGIQTYAIGTNGGPLAADNLYDLVGLVEDANAVGEKLALITSPKGLRKLKKQRIAQFSGDSGGTYLVPPLLTDEALSKAIGLNCLTTTQLPVNLVKGTSTDCTEVYVGNFSELLIGQWGAVEILATNIGGNAWAQNAIEVRLILNVDIQTRHPQSFVYCADARTA